MGFKMLRQRRVCVFPILEATQVGLDGGLKDPPKKIETLLNMANRKEKESVCVKKKKEIVQTIPRPEGFFFLLFADHCTSKSIEIGGLDPGSA